MLEDMTRALVVIDVQESFRQRPLWQAISNPRIADDVARLVDGVRAAGDLVVWILHTEPGSGGTFDLAGPEPIRQDDLVRQFLNATGDARTVITDPKALYFGITVNDQSLTPGDHPRLGPTRFEDWLSSRSMAEAR